MVSIPVIASFAAGAAIALLIVVLIGARAITWLRDMVDISTRQNEQLADELNREQVG